MYAEFEEKKYEHYMNWELAEGRKFNPTGQYEESLIGIDDALFSNNTDFLDLWPTPLVLMGIVVRPELWGLDKDVINVNNFPPFRCNVFIQYKRPEHIFGHNSKEYAIWQKSYYRFKINNKQQQHFV